MKPVANLKILLVEDDELFRLGLRMRLQQEPDFEIAGEAEDAETALELINRYPLNIVLLDLGLPGIGSLEACRQIKQKYPDIPVLVLTSRFEKPLIARLIEAGAQGYCLKGIDAQALCLAIRSVATGASWWDKAVTTEIRAAFVDSYDNSNLSVNNSDTKQNITIENPLTKREQEILALVAAGKNNQEIAEMLYITTGTVRVHVHAILQKLEVRDRTQAAIVAIQNQWVNSDYIE